MSEKILYAVRAKFNDPSGTATHEYLFGSDPTVFSRKDAAEWHAEKLQDDAELCDWGDAEPPKYYVEEISRDDMWEAEFIAGESR